MEKQETEYQKYNEWFRLIEKRYCLDNCWQGRKTINPKGYSEQFEYYILDNGLHVYINDSDMIITSGKMKDAVKTPKMQRRKTEEGVVIFLSFGDRVGRISCFSDGTNNSILNNGKGAENIESLEKALKGLKGRPEYQAAIKLYESIEKIVLRKRIEIAGTKSHVLDEKIAAAKNAPQIK